jgi:hypothetical protein
MQLLFTTAAGEVVECGEEQGVVQGIQGPPEDEEEEGDEAEEGEEAAAADEQHPVPKGQDTDPHGFPIKDSYYITLAALPERVKNMLVLVTSFGGAGMRDVKALHARVVDASAPDPNAHRDLFLASLPSAKGAHSNRSIAVLAKLYKETLGAALHAACTWPARRPHAARCPEHACCAAQARRCVRADSPFAMLRNGSARPLAEYIDDAQHVRETLMALRDTYCAELATQAALSAALEAEENGEACSCMPTLLHARAPACPRSCMPALLHARTPACPCRSPCEALCALPPLCALNRDALHAMFASIAIMNTIPSCRDATICLLLLPCCKPLAGLCLYHVSCKRGCLASLRNSFLSLYLSQEHAQQEDVVKPSLKQYSWRVTAVKVLDVAEDAAAYCEAEAKRTAAFEGSYNSMGRREGPLVRAVYENGDCYIGQYVDDQRSGKGMYVHANKAAFAGVALLLHTHGVF